MEDEHHVFIRTCCTHL